MEHETRDHQHAHHQHAGEGEDNAVLAELLDLDARVLAGYLADVTGRAADLADDQPVRRIADLGCGTGNGSVALAKVFGEAEIVAVDQSDEFLAWLRAKASDLGLGDRVHTVKENLDENWPALGTVDLVWMSMSLHHLAEPDGALTRILAALRPGGLLAVAEMGAHLRFLPDDVGRGEPGLECRCQAALAGLMADTLPDLGSDWGPRLSAAGFSAVTRQDFEIAVDQPLPPEAGRYAQLTLLRTRSRLEGLISADDLAVLDAIVGSDGPESVLHREDLAIRGMRTLWTGKRS